MRNRLHFIIIIILYFYCPCAWAEMKTSTIIFTKANPGSTIVADGDGLAWTFATNATTKSYNEQQGACFNVTNNSRTYVTLRSPIIPGKVHRIVVNASGPNNPTLTLFQHHGSTTLTNTNQEYEYGFYFGGTSQNVVVSISSTINKGEVRIKSVVVEYDDEATLAKDTKYELVTDLEQLKNEDEIIITKKEGNTYHAMGQHFNNQQRIATDITWNEDGTFNNINDFCPIILEKTGALSTNGESIWNFRAFDGYLYNNSTSNKPYISASRKAVAGNNMNATITFNTDGEAMVFFPDNQTNYKYLFYNNSNHDFNCSASSTQLSIFRKVTSPKTIDVTFKKKFGGWTSLYYEKENLIVPNSFKAYGYGVENGVGSTTKCYATGDIIPKNCAVILHLNDEFNDFGDNDSKTFTIETTREAGVNDSENCLLGLDAGGTTVGPDGNDTGYEFFRLTLDARQSEGSIGFYWGEENGGAFTVGEHKAYLAIPKEQSANTNHLSLKIFPYFKGDANGDGEVNVTDVMIVVKYILGHHLDAFKKGRSDMNSDLDINVTDVMMIVKSILGVNR